MKSKSLVSKESLFDRSIKLIFEYKWILVFFLPFVFIQLFQMTFVQWDKVAYIFGGKWFCGNQIYLELIRPPLPSALNCIFGAADFSILLTTFFACVVYLAGVFLLYKKHKKELSQPIFALFIFLFPSVLFNFNFGSDLLALAFILLAFGLSESWKKGVAFALATLSRYNYLAFALVFFWEYRKHPKKAFLFLIPIVLLWIPWIIFNYLYTGNPFFSIYESSFLNVVGKGVIAPLNIDQLVVLALFLFSLIALGVKKILKDGENQAGIIAVIMFLFSGIKELRFLGLVNPIIAFNAGRLSNKSKEWTLVFVFIFAFFYFFVFWNYSRPNFVSNIPAPSDDFVFSCRVASDNWVFLYEKGIVAEFLPGQEYWQGFLREGGNIVLYNYKNFDLNGFNVIDRNDYVILKSNTCAPQPNKYISGPLRRSVYKWLFDTNSKVYDYSDWVD